MKKRRKSRVNPITPVKKDLRAASRLLIQAEKKLEKLNLHASAALVQDKNLGIIAITEAISQAWTRRRAATAYTPPVEPPLITINQEA